MRERSKWRSFPLLDLSEDSVDIWETSIDPDEAELKRLSAVLTSGELDRAARYATEKANLQYIVSRALQRRILAAYTGDTPEDVRFSWVAQGKPVLSPNPLGISFNTTHSGNLTLLAVSRREVGIDVESVRPLPRALAVAKRFFTVAEFEAVQRAEDGERERAFLSIWTRREGGAKARGLGVWRGLAYWDDRVDPNDRAIPPGHGPWSTQMLELGPDYVGAVIASGDDWRIRRREYPADLSPPIRKSN